MKQLILLLILCSAIIFVGFYLDAVKAQTAATVVPTGPEVTQLNLQVWAKDYHEVDCGKYISRAMLERETIKQSSNNAAGTNLVLMDMSLYWGCLELNRQVNGVHP